MTLHLEKTRREIERDIDELVAAMPDHDLPGEHAEQIEQLLKGELEHLDALDRAIAEAQERSRRVWERLTLRCPELSRWSPEPALTRKSMTPEPTTASNPLRDLWNFISTRSLTTQKRIVRQLRNAAERDYGIMQF
jgi:hypothetical protein